MRIFIIVAVLGVVSALGQESTVGNKTSSANVSIEEAPLEAEIQQPQSQLPQPTIEGEVHDKDSTKAAEMEKAQNNDDDGEDMLPECIPRMCTRIYRPVCVSINGTRATIASECELNNQVRCARAKARAGKQAPTYRYLHEGKCGDRISRRRISQRQRQNSKYLYEYW